MTIFQTSPLLAIWSSRPSRWIGFSTLIPKIGVRTPRTACFARPGLKIAFFCVAIITDPFPHGAQGNFQKGRMKKNEKKIKKTASGGFFDFFFVFFHPAQLFLFLGLLMTLHHSKLHQHPHGATEAQMTMTTQRLSHSINSKMTMKVERSKCRVVRDRGSDTSIC